VLLLGLWACLGRAGARAADPATEPDLVWRLAPSEVAIYDVAPVTVTAGKDVLGTSTVRTVFGHDLRDDGQYRPVTARRDDLQAIFALRLPPPGIPSPAESPFRLDVQDVVSVHGKAVSMTTQPADGPAQVEATYTFASKGPPDGDDAYDVKDGMAMVSLRFDRARRVVTSSRVRLVSTLRPQVVLPKADRPKPAESIFQWTLKEVRSPGYDGFETEVGKAIDRGVAWLKPRQEADGGFPTFQSWRLGVTALVCLTLAECGVPREDPVLDKALSWIAHQMVPTKTYERALALMAFERAYTPVSEEALLKSGAIHTRVRNLTPERRAWCEKAAQALLVDVVGPGEWGYPAAPRSTLPFDSSNTQYGALGLRAASRLGIPISETTWVGLIRHFDLVREKKGPRATISLLHEGVRPPAPGQTAAPSAAAEKVDEVAGFLYAPRDAHSWTSMTCAGIASLELARFELDRTKSPKWTPPLAAQVDKEILGGWAWLDRHWGVDRHAEKPGDDWHLYALYSLERAGVFSRVKTVNGKDWYFEGAMWLLRNQAPEGTWDERGADKQVGTCFALLFLKRATPPLTNEEGK